MDNINFSISGFKCFSDKNFTLKNVTLLTGSNGTGKSSFIQALLLVRASIEKNSIDSHDENFINPSWKNIPVPLNGPFELNLGSIEDIFNEKSSKNGIKITIGEEEFNIGLLENDQSDIVSISLEQNYQQEILPFWRKKEFYYLNTERLGPRLGVNSVHTEFPNCSYKGENTGKVLAKLGLSKKITGTRFFPNIKSANLEQQVNAWLNNICPGTSGVQAKEQDPGRFQIVVSSSAAIKSVLAPNIGFGISYALPIIVNGLIAEPDSIFIVENPEAHLHPKGQSNMGYFLGMVAASGIRLVIETHSEHIVNGIRRASLTTSSLLPENVGIYFFEEFIDGNESPKEILISESGELESFPKDFFDQVSQDMVELFKLKIAKSDG